MSFRYIWISSWFKADVDLVRFSFWLFSMWVVI
jgi:hypothetical protein